ncbi:MAG: hypothetical protein LBT79_07670 [Elusimicrobiota bacterium]|jgi:hypothetical protein|nr:hypothetical protein [Elusimicrobiota bacterium]
MINIPKISISYDEVLMRLGYSKSRTKIDDRTQILIKENISLSNKLINPKIVVAFDEISLQNECVLFNKGYKISSFDIVKLLKDCFMGYGIAITIGEALESKRDDFLKQKEVFNALILDAAGSVGAENCIQALHEQIEKLENDKGNAITRRYSCGYGDWRLKEQKDFLNWLGADAIGIKVNDSYMMKPEKSISALLGVKRRKSE